VTGSGLGCPTWPACDASSLAPTPELGINGLIEFGNRLFTGVIIVAVAWVIISARLQKPRVRSLTRLAWSQFWLVVVNAVAGGLSVLTGLNPWVVALHFVMAIALLTTTTLTWHRARQQPFAGFGPASGSAVSRRAAGAAMSVATRALAWVLVAATLILIVVGTMVSGSGPHSGAASAKDRMAFDWTIITIVHGSLAFVVLALAAVLLVVLLRTDGASVARRRVVTLIVILLAQGVIGVVQALNGLPDLLVALHLLGAALVWAGVLRVVLDVDPRVFGGRPGIAANTQHSPSLGAVLTDSSSGL
jgi:cytochrome c oxidase assembly protein subunit 15